MEDNFKQQRHKDYSISFEYLRELLKNKVNKMLISFEKVVSGVDKEVYKVMTEDSVLYVLFNHYGTDFRNEAWANNKAQKAGVPVPDILFSGIVERDGLDVECMIESEISGTEVASIWNELSLENKNKIIIELSKNLQKLHSVSAGGFYEMDKSGTWDFETFTAMMDSAIHDRREEFEYSEESGLTQRELDKCLKYMTLYRDLQKDAQPILCHGVLCLRHIFVDGNYRITGLIDFGGFRGGLVQDDFEILYFELEPELWNLLVSSYFEGDVPENFNYLMNLHQINHFLGKIASSVKKDRMARAENRLKRLRNVLLELDNVTN